MIFDNEEAGVKQKSSFTNMPPKIKWAIAALCAAVLIGLFYLPRLWRGARDLGKPATSDEQARREIVQPPIVTPTDAKVQAQLFWISASNPGTLETEDSEPGAFGGPGAAFAATSERADSFAAYSAATHAAGGYSAAGFLFIARRYGDRGFRGHAFDGNSIRNHERAACGGFHYENAWRFGSANPTAENFIARTGSGHAGRSCGFDRIFRIARGCVDVAGSRAASACCACKLWRHADCKTGNVTAIGTLRLRVLT